MKHQHVSVAIQFQNVHAQNVKGMIVLQYNYMLLSDARL